MLMANVQIKDSFLRSHKNPDDIPVPPDQQPLPPVRDPRPSPGREDPDPEPPPLIVEG